MIRHSLAPVLPTAAAALQLPRTLDGTGVTLTFDDGPHPEGTPAVLESLARARARGIFFLVGEQVVRRPELVRELVAGGHLVGVHGYTHRLQLRRTRASLEDDLVRARAAIEDAAGIAPAWHRPPYGVYSASGLALARGAGMKPLLWSKWGKDWRKFTTAERIAARATREITAGDVILLHDADFYSASGSHRRTAVALQLILRTLAERGVATVLPA